MLSPIHGYSPPPMEIIPSPAKPEQIPSHGFEIEDRVTLYDKGVPDEPGNAGPDASGE
jgi:hypothetical protein